MAGDFNAPPYINESSLLRINTFLHYWMVCLETGNAYTLEKRSGIIRHFVKRIRGMSDDPYSAYDYFDSPGHIEWTLEESKRVIEDLFVSKNIPLANQRILDISGGTGIVAQKLQEHGAQVVLMIYRI